MQEGRKATFIFKHSCIVDACAVSSKLDTMRDATSTQHAHTAMRSSYRTGTCSTNLLHAHEHISKDPLSLHVVLRCNRKTLRQQMAARVSSTACLSHGLAAATQLPAQALTLPRHLPSAV